MAASLAENIEVFVALVSVNVSVEFLLSPSSFTDARREAGPELREKELFASTTRPLADSDSCVPPH